MSPNIKVNSPYILKQSGVPVGLAPDGTVATNGVVTLGTALPRIYSNGIWLRLPAGAVSGGAAGLYWCVMSSTTVGQVYTNFVDTSLGFTPYIPTGALTPAVGSGVAYTAATGVDITLVNVNLTGNSLGNNGILKCSATLSTSNEATAKPVKLFLSSKQVWQMNYTTSGENSFISGFSNAGVPTQQTRAASNFSATGLGAVNTTANTASVDTTINQPITLTSQVGLGTQFVIFENISLQVLPS